MGRDFLSVCGWCLLERGQSTDYARIKCLCGHVMSG
jgi:hypothetical protein